jgi:hypothetical protein
MLEGEGGLVPPRIYDLIQIRILRLHFGIWFLCCSFVCVQRLQGYGVESGSFTLSATFSQY